MADVSDLPDDKAEFRPPSEEEEDEEMSSAEEDEEELRRPKKKSKLSDIFDLDAEVSDEDEEEEYDQELEEEEARIAEDLVDNAEYDDRRTDYMRVDNMRNFDQAAEELVRNIQERHQQYVMQHDVDQAEFESSSIRQQARQPTINDPKLWLVKVKPGMERDIVSVLMMKYLTVKSAGEDSNVFSATCLDHLSGYIYVEAFKETFVRAFVTHINGVYASKIQQVPLKEMVPVLSVPKKKHILKVGEWVRVKRGDYRGDLAQVYQYNPANNALWIKLVPRIDLEGTKIAAEEATLDPEEPPVKRGRKRPREGPRPPQRLYAPEEIDKFGGERESVRNTFGDVVDYYEGNQYLNGFLVKKMNFKGVDALNVNPTLEELQWFQGSQIENRAEDGEEDQVEESDEIDDLDDKRQKKELKAAKAIVLASTINRAVVFQKGDVVSVKEGELKSLVGTVDDITGDIAQVIPEEKSIGRIPVPIKYLSKHFRAGDHVKVLVGKHESETGMVVKVADSVAVIISDVANQEFKSRVSDLQLTKEVSAGLKFGEYSLFDMVQISPTEVGVIVRIEGETAQVLDANDVTRTVKVLDILRKKDSTHNVGRDCENAPVGRDDKVRVLSGKYAGEAGTVKHLYRIMCFIHSTKHAENSGMFVTRTRNTQIQGHSANRLKELAQGKSAGMRLGQKPQYGFGARPRKKRNDPLLHRTVMITSGPWKGLAGLVKDTTDVEATVELTTNARRVQVLKDKVLVLDESGIRTNYVTGGAQDEWADFGKTPLRGDQTPHRSAMTPAYAPMTPRNDGGQAQGYGDDFYSSQYGSMMQTPNQAPSTPATAMPSTPGVSTPFARPPVTPSMHPYPSPAPVTPAGGYATYPTRVQTPLDPRTPDPYADRFRGYGNAVGTPMLVGTPHMGTPAPVGTPHTPATVAPMHWPPGTAPVTPGSVVPSTPAPDVPVSAPAGPWYIPNVFVKVDESVEGADAEAAYVVVSVNGTRCTVVLEAGGGELEVEGDQLTGVPPQKRDRVVVIDGLFYGQSGALIGIDNLDGIVKMDNGEIRIVPMNTLIKSK